MYYFLSYILPAIVLIWLVGMLFSYTQHFLCLPLL